MAQAHTTTNGAHTATSDHPTVKGGLEEFERNDTTRPPFILTTPEIKLLGIAGVGFFLDGIPFVYFVGCVLIAYPFFVQRMIYSSSMFVFLLENVPSCCL